MPTKPRKAHRELEHKGRDAGEEAELGRGAAERRLKDRDSEDDSRDPGHAEPVDYESRRQLAPAAPAAPAVLLLDCLIGGGKRLAGGWGVAWQWRRVKFRVRARVAKVRDGARGGEGCCRGSGGLVRMDGARWQAARGTGGSWQRAAGAPDTQVDGLCACRDGEGNKAQEQKGTDEAPDVVLVEVGA